MNAPCTMNNTSTINDSSGSFGWLSESDPANVFMGMEKLEAPPFLIGSDSDFSSQDGSVHSLCGSDFAKVKKVAASPVKRKVSLNSRVEVREYSMTIGDHPCCNDGLPMTLDWAYSTEYVYRDIDESRVRSRAYRMPRRMSFDEKRERLFKVGQYNESETHNEEINMVMRMLQHSWSQNHILPAMKFEEIVDIEMEEEEEEKPTPVDPVITWKRNRHPMRRSESFCE
jgi:hypothetical protein